MAAPEITGERRGYEPWIEAQDGAGRSYIGTLSLAETLGVSDEVLKEFGFENAHVFAIETGETEQPTLELQFDGTPLDTIPFLRLLEAVAPTNSRSYSDDGRIGDILADWVIFEKRDGFATDLFLMHSGLKGWAQFGQEYERLKTTLIQKDKKGWQPPIWALPGNSDIVRPAEYIEDWGQAPNGLVSDPLIESSELFKLFSDVYDPEYAQTQVIRAMRHAIQQKTPEAERASLDDLTGDELLARFHSLDIEARNRLVSIMAIESTYDTDGSSGWTISESTERLRQIYLERHCVTFETDDGQLMYAHGISPDTDIQRAYDERRKVHMGFGRPRYHALDQGVPFEYELMEVNTIIGRQTVIIPGSLKFQEVGTIPVVRWSLGPDGKRVYQDLPPLPEDYPITHNIPSGITGLLALAYLQPDKRKGWMKKASLPGSDFAQDMGPAQVPILALQHAEQLLANGLVEQAESLLGN